MSNCLRSEAQLTCNVCGQLYEEPRILPCLHTFCTKCIESLDAFIPSLLPPVGAKSATDPGKSGALKDSSQISCTLESKESGASGYETGKSPSTSVASLPLPGFRSRGRSTSRSTLQSENSMREKSRTILCPTCDSEVDLPRDGVCHLPLHYILQNKVLTVTLSDSISDAGDEQSYQKSLCELCVSDVHAVSWCIDCQANICAFCSEAHKRQRKTGAHRVLTLQEAQGRRLVGCPGLVALGNRDRPWPVCPQHPTEELCLFCETCQTTVCRDCCMSIGEHRTHRSRFVSEVAKEKIADLRNLLATVVPSAEALRSSLANVRATAKQVLVRESEAAREVNDFVDDYVKALEVHRQNLLERVKKMCEIKQRILKLQCIQLEQALEDVQTLCSFIAQLLQEGSEVEILTLLGHVEKRHKDLGTEKYRLEPRIDEYLQFLRDEVAGQVNGFLVKGVLTAQKICPSKCILKGNGVPAVRQGQKVDVVLIAKDMEGLPMRKGGQHPKVELLYKDDSNKRVPVKTTDRKDGTYLLSFHPEETGLYWLNVKFQDKHIQGSPYPVTVKSKWQSHSGKFHCCTFCSSGGRKDVKCGCGGTMPGGFKGCGHGHEGHPGKKHWSCCGTILENSECSRPPPRIFEYTI